MTRIVLRRSDKSIRVVRTSPTYKVNALKRRVTIKRSGFGPAGSDSDKTFTQVLTNQSQVTVTHNLGKYPAVTVTDSTGDEVEGYIEHLSINELVATFSSSFTGRIVCN